MLIASRGRVECMLIACGTRVAVGVVVGVSDDLLIATLIRGIALIAATGRIKAPTVRRSRALTSFT